MIKEIYLSIYLSIYLFYSLLFKKYICVGLLSDWKSMSKAPVASIQV